MGILLIVILSLAACRESPSSAQAVKKDGTNAFIVTPMERSITEEDLTYFALQMKEIYKRGTLRVAMPSTDRKPFFYNNDKGILSGSDVDIAADMAAQLGVKVEYIRTAGSFDQVINQVAAGKVDIAISKLSATLPRAEKVLFSDPYLKLHQGILLNRLAMARLGSTSLDPFQRLSQAKVKLGVIAGTSYVGYANLLFAKARIIPYATPQESMDAAIKGEVAAIYYDELQLKQLLANNPDSSIDLQLHIMKDRDDLIAIAIPPSNVQLLSWVNLYLQSNRARIEGLLIQYGIESSQAP